MKTTLMITLLATCTSAATAASFTGPASLGSPAVACAGGLSVTPSLATANTASGFSVTGSVTFSGATGPYTNCIADLGTASRPFDVLLDETLYTQSHLTGEISAASGGLQLLQIYVQTNVLGCPDATSIAVVSNPGAPFNSGVSNSGNCLAPAGSYSLQQSVVFSFAGTGAGSLTVNLGSSALSEVFAAGSTSVPEPAVGITTAAGMLALLWLRQRKATRD